MVHKFFDKKSSGANTSDGAATRANKSAIKSEIMPNQQLAGELHKQIGKKFKKRKVCSSFKDNIWGAHLADMQLTSENDKGFTRICPVCQGNGSVFVYLALLK